MPSKNANTQSDDDSLCEAELTSEEEVDPTPFNDDEEPEDTDFSAQGYKVGAQTLFQINEEVSNENNATNMRLMSSPEIVDLDGSSIIKSPFTSGGKGERMTPSVMLEQYNNTLSRPKIQVDETSSYNTSNQ